MRYPPTFGTKRKTCYPPPGS